jgi:hypothetical protein
MSKTPPYPLNRRLGEPQNWSGRCGVKKKSFDSAWNRTPGIQPTVRRYSTNKCVRTAVIKQNINGHLWVVRGVEYNLMSDVESIEFYHHLPYKPTVCWLQAQYRLLLRSRTILYFADICIWWIRVVGFVLPPVTNKFSASSGKRTQWLQS